MPGLRRAVRIIRIVITSEARDLLLKGRAFRRDIGFKILKGRGFSRAVKLGLVEWL